jgi:hypothetical protein
MVNTVQPKRNFFRRKWLLLLVALLFIVAITLFVLEKTHVIDLVKQPAATNDQPNPTNTVDYSPATTTDSDISNQIKQDSSDSQANVQNLQVTLTRATQDETTRELIVRALIEGTQSGTCTLELIKDDSAMLTRTASVVQQNNFATCQGFNVLPAEFPSLGEFTVKLTVTSGASSVSGTQIIVLEQ